MINIGKHLETTVSVSETSMKVLRNMYTLVSMGLMTTVLAGVVANMTGLSDFISSSFILSLAMIGLLFAVVWQIPKYMHSSAGLGLFFSLTVIYGIVLDPMVSHYLSVDKGAVLSAFAMTAFITGGMGLYGWFTKRNLGGLGRVLFVALLALVAAIIVNIFVGSSMMSMLISYVAVVVFSLYIMKDTNDIATGAETNYISAATSMYINIIGLFIHLLSIIGNDD